MNRPTTLTFETLRAWEDALLAFPWFPRLLFPMNRWFLDAYCYTHPSVRKASPKPSSSKVNYAEYEIATQETYWVTTPTTQRVIKYKRIELSVELTLRKQEPACKKCERFFLLIFIKSNFIILKRDHFSSWVRHFLVPRTTTPFTVKTGLYSTFFCV